MSRPLDERRYEVVWLIRRLFRAMAQLAEAYLEVSGISVADRAVMEFLYPDQQLSVPAIAERYNVSRQHIQVTVNRLQGKGLVEPLPNPRHKRSALMQLSEAGRAMFAGIRRNEADMLERLFADTSESDIDTTVATLRSLSEKLKQE